MPKVSMARLLERLAKARTILAQAGADALLVYGNPARLGGAGTFAHLAGWAPGEAHSALVVPAEGDIVVLSDGPNITRVFNQRLAGRGRAEAFSGSADFMARIISTLKAAGAGRIGLAGADEMGHRMHAGIAAAFPHRVTLDRPLDDLRLTRDPDEIAIQKQGADIAVEMVRTAMAVATRGNATPADIMTEAEFCGRRMGSENAGLWLATGERPPTTCFELFELNRDLGPRDRVQLGATPQLEGYFAQCLRTGVRGRPDPVLSDCMARLADIQDKALAALKPGAPLAGLGDVLEAEIDAICPYERLADPFRFQSCHAIGLSYAEPSCAAVLNAGRDRSKDGEGPVVTEGMIIEIHPNFTHPSLGHVCLGDMALVTATGARWITDFPRSLIRLD